MAMISIKKKLLVFFMLLIFLISCLALFLFYQNSRSSEQYDKILNRFFLLNEIYQQTSHVNSSIKAYVVNTPQDEEMLNNYREHSDELEQYKDQLTGLIETRNNYLTFKNFGSMIENFLEEGRLTVIKASSSRKSDYYDHMLQAEDLSGMIQEFTLRLINSELSSYQSLYSNIQHRNDNFHKMAVYAFLSAVLLCFIFTFWFSEGITRPIQKLSLAASQISRGNFNGADVIVTSRDEMRFLAEAFNGMRANIRQLVEEMKQKSEQEALLKKMELRSLQNQMKPHFLFNTLNMVMKLAYVEGAEKTSSLVHSVSALLRYHLKKFNHEVILRDEVNIVKEYCFIQQMRFGDRIAFQEDIDEKLLSCPVPSLTIQPLIENAFVHGVESFEDGAKLKLTIFERDENVVIEIADNGTGMTSVQIDNLLSVSDATFDAAGREDSDYSSEGGNGIGLRNVLRRLRLFYQTDDVMEIDSTPGAGTTIRLLLPQNTIRK